MSADEVWKANREKVSFVKQFPGRLHTWDEAAGKKIEKIIALPGRSGSMLIFQDCSFVVVSKLEPEPADLLAGLLTARSELEPGNITIYQELDRFVQREKDLLRRARLEKIMGAVTHNMPAIPELKEELLKLLSKL
ncbi:MAG: hypothetical protein L0Y56_09215 [Nitrospira sp.]|nr:hypothetical protein [Nitrospira sp.]